MFERYSEHARRAIFFALEEARGLGSARIDTVHVLLGILREDPTVAAQVGTRALETIRNELEQVAPPKAERVSAPQDLPLSAKAQRALVRAVEEAGQLDQQPIEPSHLVLGLLRMQDCTAAKLLRAYGMDYHRYRYTLRAKPGAEAGAQPMERSIDRPAPWNQAPSAAPASPKLGPSIQALQNLLDGTAAHLHAYSASYGDQRLKRNTWTRKQALGHLIDWAMAHQQWLARALTESKLTAQGYPGEAEVTIRAYAEFSWQETVDLWITLNWLLAHVLMRVPEDRLAVPCRIGIADPMPLAKLVEGYVSHCEDIVGQILARL